MTVSAMAVPLDDGLETRSAPAIFCRRCFVDVPISDILDSVAGGRPDDECPRCLTPSLILGEPDGMDVA